MNRSSSDDDETKSKDRLVEISGKGFGVAHNYVMEVKSTLSKKKYRRFLTNLHQWDKQKISPNELIDYAKELFKGHDNLLFGMIQFVPVKCRPILANEARVKKILSTREVLAPFMGRLKERLRDNLDSYTLVVNLLCAWVEQKRSSNVVYKEVVALLQNNPDLVSELRRLMADTPSTSNEQSFDFNTLPQIDNDQEDTTSTCNGPGFDLNTVPQMDDVNHQFPDNSVSPSTRNEPRFDLKKENFIFLENVKARLSNANDYEKLMEYLYHYSSGIFTNSELRILVDALLGKHPRLLDRFHNFLDYCEKDDGYLAALISKIEDAKGVKRRYKQKNNSTEKSRDGVDVLNCKIVTPSYRLLPDDYPILPASYKSVLDAEVLNDQCIIPRESGSEGHSAKNPYEEVLHECESHRFEVDMLLEYVHSTIKRLEEFLDKIVDNTVNSENPVPVEKYLTVHNISCIKQLYFKCPMNMMDVLREDPVSSSRVILSRLKQRKREWTEFRADLNKVWARVYSKNHEKSLDHRSWYFKKQDAVNLSNNVLLAEIKENPEPGLNKDDQTLASFLGKGERFILTLNYDNSDNEIHEALHKLILHSCKRECSKKERFNNAIKLWTNFIKPMLCLPSMPATKISKDLSPSLKGSTAMKCFLLETKVNGSGQKGHPEFDPTVEKEVEARPLTLYLPSLKADKGEKESRVFYGNDHFYILFRLHQILYGRILSAKMMCTAAAKKGTILKDTSSANPYARFMNALNRWLGGYIDDQKFEGTCMAIMGNKSYNLFTLNELITKLSKQLGTVATDKMDRLLLQLYEYEKSRLPEKYNDAVYLNNARLSLQNKNLYRFEFLSSQSRLTIKLIEEDTECQPLDKVSQDPNFPYLNEEYLTDHIYSEDGHHALMLRRNMHKYAKLDEVSASLMAMEDVKVMNNLEYRMCSETSKIIFIRDTEDLFYRKRNNTKPSTRKIINFPVYTCDAYQDQS